MSGAGWRDILRGNVGVMVASWVLFSIGGALARPYFSLYIKMLGGQDFHIGLVSSIGTMSSLMLLIPGGYLTDAYGRRRTIVTFTWVIVLLTFLYVLVPSWEYLLVVYALDSLLHFYTPALSAIIMDSLPPDARAKGAALTGIVTNIPWFFLPTMGGFLVDKYGMAGLRMAYALSGAMGLAAAYLRTRLLRETIEVDERAAGKPFLKIIADSYLDSLSVLGKIPRMVVVLLAYSAAISAPSAVVFANYGVVYAKEILKVSAAEWGLYSSIANAASTLLTAAALPFLDRIPRKMLMALSSFLMFLVYAIFIRATAWQAGLAVTLYYVSHSLHYPAWSAYLADSVRRELRGRVNALSQISGLAGFIWAGILMGYLYSLNPDSAITISAAISLADSIFLLAVVKEPKTREVEYRKVGEPSDVKGCCNEARCQR